MWCWWPTGSPRQTRSRCPPRRSRGAGLGYATPFPDPRVVARHQARALRSLYHEWREQVSEWRSQASGGTPLSEAQLESLRLQVGIRELERLGLTGRRRGLDDAAPRRARGRGAGGAARARRSPARGPTPTARVPGAARGGRGPLEDVLIGELAEDWGQELTAALAAGQPGSWGPAATAITQDPRAALPVLQLADERGRAPGLRRWT